MNIYKNVTELNKLSTAENIICNISNSQVLSIVMLAESCQVSLDRRHDVNSNQSAFELVTSYAVFAWPNLYKSAMARQL